MELFLLARGSMMKQGIKPSESVLGNQTNFFGCKIFLL